MTDHGSPEYLVWSIRVTAQNTNWVWVKSIHHSSSEIPCLVDQGDNLQYE
jgi:hypothetical protein